MIVGVNAHFYLFITDREVRYSRAIIIYDNMHL